MKLKITILVTVLLCGIVAATSPPQQPFIIAPLVWDAEGNLEEGVPVTFVFGNQSHTLHTDAGGSCCFDCQNFDNITEGAQINVSCKYGYRIATVDHGEFGQGVTFNELSEAAAIAVYAAMGFAVTAIGGGLYLLRKKGV